MRLPKTSLLWREMVYQQHSAEINLQGKASTRENPVTYFSFPPISFFTCQIYTADRSDQINSGRTTMSTVHHQPKFHCQNILRTTECAGSSYFMFGFGE
jgi:hypothetical protein